MSSALALVAPILLLVLPWTVAPVTDDRPPPVAVVRTAGALDHGLLTALADIEGVESVVAVDAETRRLTDTSSGVDWPDGYGVAVDLLGVDPAAYAPLVGAPTALTTLSEGEVVLSASAARQRGVDVGGWVEVEGVGRLVVHGVVADGLVDGVTGLTTRATLGGRTRYALVTTRPATGARAAVDAVAATAHRTLVRDVGRAPWSVGWRTVASLTALEDAVGPLVHRPAAGRSIAVHSPLDIVRADVPILGAVTCHEVIIPPLRQALGDLEQAGLAHLVDPGDYAGCHSPRLMAPGGPLSRHAWGIAVDINATTNGFGATPTMDPRVVEAFEAAGFVWGGGWPTPDGMHFEWHPGT